MAMQPERSTLEKIDDGKGGDSVDDISDVEINKESRKLKG